MPPPSPSSSKLQQTIADLADAIRHHRRLYTKGTPEISDAQYDALEEKLASMVPNHPLLSEVGYNSGGKTPHAVVVLSLEKTREFKHLKFWARKHHQLLPPITNTFFPPPVALSCLYKLDGAFISLVYQNGHFVLAKTRGDGTYGENVTQKILHVASVVKTSSTLKDLSLATLDIRGELCCTQDSFAKLKEEMQKRGLDIPKNRRNIVAGVLGRKDHEDLAKYFSFYAFDIVDKKLGEDHLFTTEYEKLEFLSKSGFVIAPFSNEKENSTYAKIFPFATNPEWELCYKDSKLQWIRARKSRKKTTLNTRHLKNPLANIPLTLKATKANFSISGEITCPPEHQAELSELLTRSGLHSGLQKKSFETSTENLLASLANLADADADADADINHSHTTQNSELAPLLASICNLLQFHAYDAEDSHQDTYFVGDAQKHAWLKEQGFNFSQCYLDFLHYLKNTQAFAGSSKRHLDIDGIVLSYNTTATHSLAGYTSHHPNFRLSYKWQGDEVKSHIEEVVWDVSKAGTITPVALIKKVSVGGAMIRRVTLHNKRTFEKLAPHVGDEVYVIRAGEVTPRISRIIHKHPSTPPKLPQVCPACNSPLDVTLSQTWIICTNSLTCPPQIIGKIDHWCKSVDIQDISKKRLTQLLKNHIITDIPSLYELASNDSSSSQANKEALYAMDGFGEKMVDKICLSIQRSKHMSVEQFLIGLGIKGLQKASVRLLLKHFSFEDITTNLKKEDILSIKGFAAASAHTIATELEEKRPLIHHLQSLGVTPKA